MASSHAPRIVQSPHGRILVFDSATYVEGYVAEAPQTTGDLVVNASYSGVLCARMVMSARPRAVIGLDCAIGKDGAGIAGLWYYEALAVPSAAVDVMTAEMGNGSDLYDNGIVSRVNDAAQALGIEPGMRTRDAAQYLLTGEKKPAVFEPTRRRLIHTAANGRSIVCTDSIAYALPEDRERNVLCTAGHTGRSVIGYFRDYRPWAFICSDGGVGKNNSGLSALEAVEADGIPGASVSALTARMGDGQSTYFDGVISAANKLARDKGVQVGQSAKEAALRLLD
ncbi:hypothetical protein H6CHR_03698 [Variovorax sp. PBL-H6]|uniref:hypothetical protein n=1 Tax=Variovorax sp. PBL-H6 TaxID=434009 RepID=UPI00131620EE|nr:hypothetical protein [Variovorax sp. PBL-H6]VTU31922.1 hypothetical protein H6CHR_03698 [Variovorax sp. PBL-H6]